MPIRGFLPILGYNYAIFRGFRGKVRFDCRFDCRFDGYGRIVGLLIGEFDG